MINTVINGHKVEIIKLENNNTGDNIQHDFEIIIDNNKLPLNFKNGRYYLTPLNDFLKDYISDIKDRDLMETEIFHLCASMII